MYVRRTYRYTIALAAALSAAHACHVRGDDPSASSERERKLIGALESDAPAAEKALTCKLLAIYGTGEAVDALAKLLPDPRLSSWARIALEAIPSEKADQALRQAIDSLDGKLLVGTINSIGVRRDEAAADRLARLLNHKDSEVASAAAVSLGKIGNEAATRALRSGLATAPPPVRSAVAEGCMLCAERLQAGGNSTEAASVYDQVRGADVPLQRIIEATRGAILARGRDGVPLLIQQLRSPEKKMFQLALSTAREIPGSEVDKALAAELDRAPPARAALIIEVMADRPQTVVLPAVAKAAAGGPKPVRLAAIGALQRVGDGSSVATLMDAALAADPDIAQAAQSALAGLNNEQVDAQITARLAGADGKSYRLLIELIGLRRIDAVPDLLKALEHPNRDVRKAALIALGETAALDQLPVLISHAVAPKNPDDAPAARQALRAASVRMPDRDACAAQLAAAMKRAPSEAKTVLLEILADVGGAKSLATLASAAKSDDPQLQDTASRLLGRWNGVEAAPVLLDLARTAPETKYQIRALRGYIGLARKFAMPEPQRVAMCRKAWDAAQRNAERELVLEVLKLRPSGGGLQLAVKAMQDPKLKAPATQAAVAIAQKLGGSKADVSTLLSQAGFDEVKLEIIKAEYGAGSTFKDVTPLVRKHAGNVPLIVLPNASYNASFGGDPLPGTVKQLRIQYRMDGKVGQASFAENALIILPVPK